MAGFDASLLSFLEIDRNGSVNVSKLSFRPHVTAGAGGFVDITARAKKIVFSGMFNAGAKLAVADGRLVIEKDGKLKKLVNEVEHVTFSGRRGVEQGQDVTYVTERCVMKLTPEGIVLTEIAPGVDLQAHILDQSEFPLIVSDRSEDDGRLPLRRGADRAHPATQARTCSRGGGACLSDWQKTRHLRAGRRGRHRHAAPTRKIQRARHPDAARARSGA